VTLSGRNSGKKIGWTMYILYNNIIFSFRVRLGKINASCTVVRFFLSSNKENINGHLIGYFFFGNKIILNCPGNSD